MITDADPMMRAVVCAPMTSEPAPDVQDSPVRGALIRQLREAMNDGQGMSRQVFATTANMSTSTLQRAEDSEPGTTVSTLSRIARVLGVPLSMIYDNDALANMDAVPSNDPPAWFTHHMEQQDARLRSIEAAQAEILRALRSNR